MVAGAYRHALLVQQHAHIRRVSAFQQEGQYTDLIGGGADDFQAVESLSLFGGVDQEGIFMGLQCLAILLIEPVNDSGQADSPGNVGGAGFEFVGQLVPGSLFEAHRFDKTEPQP